MTEMEDTIAKRTLFKCRPVLRLPVRYTRSVAARTLH